MSLSLRVGLVLANNGNRPHALTRLFLPALPGLALLAGSARTWPEAAEAGQPLFVIVYRAGSAWRAGAPMAEQPGMPGF